MATTAGKLRQNIRNFIYSSYPHLRPRRYIVSGAVCGLEDDVGHDAEIAVRGGGWAVGDIVENEATGEQMYLLEKCSSNETFELWAVDRGYASTFYDPDATLTGDKFRGLRNPRFTQYQIDEAIKYTLEDLERMRVYTFATCKFRPGDQINLEGYLEGLSMYTYQSGRVLAYPFRSLGSGIGVPEEQVKFAVRELPNCDFYILYKKKILRPEDLMPRQVPIIPVGAVAELLSHEVVQATADPGRRTDRSVSSGQELRDTLNLRRMYMDRCGKEAQLLKREARRQVSDLNAESIEKFRA